MKVQICSVKRLYQILAAGDTFRCAAMISSASKIDEGKLYGIPFVFRQYEDLDYECPGRAFSRKDAACFAGFVRQLEGDMTLYCCCDAGESRSPAAAAAVMRYLGMDDMEIWRDPHYHPNLLVYDFLTDALGVGVTDAEKDFRFFTNQKAFRAAVRGK